MTTDAVSGLGSCVKALELRGLGSRILVLGVWGLGFRLEGWRLHVASSGCVAFLGPVVDPKLCLLKPLH